MYPLSNTTTWWMYIYIIYYIENNYMFRRLVMAIFRLYMKHIVSSYTKTYIWATYVGLGGGKVGTRSRICPEGPKGQIRDLVHTLTPSQPHISSPYICFV